MDEKRFIEWAVVNKQYDMGYIVSHFYQLMQDFEKEGIENETEKTADNSK